MASVPPRPSVVISIVSREKPWKPATSTIFPSSSDARMRSPRISRILAFVCAESVRMPACEPVYETASSPRSSIAMATSAHAMRSPVERSMSSSRGLGAGETSPARAMQLVGRLAHRRDGSHHVQAAPLGLDEPARDVPDLVRIGNRRAAELHHHRVERGLRHSKRSVGRGSPDNACVDSTQAGSRAAYGTRPSRLYGRSPGGTGIPSRSEGSGTGASAVTTRGT